MIGLALKQLPGLLIGLVLTAAALILYNTVVENPSVRSGERLLVAAEARARAMALIEQKSKDHEDISTFDASRLCGELGGRWVPNEDRCD